MSTRIEQGEGAGFFFLGARPLYHEERPLFDENAFTEGISESLAKHVIENLDSDAPLWHM